MSFEHLHHDTKFINIPRVYLVMVFRALAILRIALFQISQLLKLKTSHILSKNSSCEFHFEPLIVYFIVLRGIAEIRVFWVNQSENVSMVNSMYSRG